ncbi:MAG: S9 family peptidase [Candidatus Zixiibacteriota bacterium]
MSETEQAVATGKTPVGRESERHMNTNCVVRTCIVTLTIMIATTGITQAQTRTLTPHDIAKLANVSSVAIAPDGQQIAYTLRKQRDPFADKDGPAWVELHVVDRQGNSRPFVTGDVTVSRVAWHPNGTDISFLSKREGDDKKSLYVIPTTGGEARRVAAHDEAMLEYSWSPDGSRVAFLAKEPLPDKLEKLRKKGFDQEIFEEDERHTRIWIHSIADPDTVHRLIDVDGTASELHWSPKGNRLVCALAPTPFVDDGYMRRRIRIIDVESGAIVTKIDNPGKLGQIAWGPDGEHIAYIAGADYNDPKEGRLMVASVTTGEIRELLPDFEGHVQSIAWRDPQTVTYLAYQGVWTFIDNVGLDSAVGGKIFAAPEPMDINADVPVGASEQDAVYSNVSLSKDGHHMALTGESARHPAEVYYRQTNNEPIRLTDSNPWLADYKLARQEVIRYPARDGLEIEAVIIRPLDEQPGQRYPAIMKVHGGPESHYRNGWMTSYASPGQMAAAKGMFVVHQNYRGSTGRGVAFSKTSQGDPAGKEFDDIVDGIDYMMLQGWVDSAKVGITGGSYGGYASGWGATYYSERYAASVMSVGLGNLISKIGTTDIPREMLAVHYTDPPWDNWDFVLKRSPIYYAGQSKTPTLILHGKNDPRVFPGQSLDLYRHLKLRGQATVRLVFYPGEGHGNRDAAARLDFCMRMMRWMEHYLLGPGGDPPDWELDYERN